MTTNAKSQNVNNNSRVVIGRDIKNSKLINVGDVEGNYNAIGDGAKVIIEAISQATERKEMRLASDQLLGDAVKAKVDDYVRRVEKSKREQTINPYKDLRAYQLTDASFFYGREAEIGDLLDQIHDAPLTILHADSGAGKSSLIQAGLMSRLLAAGHLPLYIRTRARSTSQSQEQLGLSHVIKAEIMPEIESGVTEHDPELARLSRKSLRDFLTDISRILNLSTLYILIDQFEDFFANALMHPDLRQSFVDDLNSCRFDQSLDVRWILSLRKEYYSDLDTFGKGVFDNQYRLYGFTEKEAKEVIIYPAKQSKVIYETDLENHDTDLVDTIIEDLRATRVGRHEIVADTEMETVVAEKVAPPHIQLVCYQLFEELGKSPAGKTITKELYEKPRGQRKLSGAEGILTGHLHIVLSRLSPKDRQIASLVFEELVTSQSRRIPRNKADLVANLQLRRADIEISNIDPLLSKLVDERLLKTDQDDLTDYVAPDETTTYELTHDYLLQEIDFDETTRDRKAAQEFLDQEMIAYQINDRSRISDEKLSLIAQHEENLRVNPNADELMQKSRDAIGRRKRTVKLGFGTAAVAFIAALIFGLFAQSSIREATKAQETVTAANATGTAIAQQIQTGAATATAVSAQSESIRLATESQRALDHDPEQGVRLAKDALTQAHTVEAENALRLAMHSVRVTDIITHEIEGITHSTFSYDSRFTAWVNEKQEIEVRDAKTGEILSTYFLEGGISRMSFGTDENYWLIAGSAHGEIAIWDIEKNWDVEKKERLLSIFHKSGEPITALAISPNSEYVVTGSWDDHSINLWSVPEGKNISIQSQEGFLPSDLAINPEQSLIAIGNKDGGIMVWDGLLKEELGRWNDHNDYITDVTFSPDGSQLATGGVDNKIFIWNSAKWDTTEPFEIEQLYQFDAHKSSVFHITYSPNGGCVATSSADTTTIVWSLIPVTELFDRGEIVATLAGHKDTVAQAAFLPIESPYLMPPTQPCGSQLKTIGLDQTVRTWNIGATSELKTVVEHEGYIEAVQYSVDGRFLGTASDDKSAKILETESFQPIHTIQHEKRVNDIQFNHNGTFAVTASRDGTSKIIEIENGEERILKGHEGWVHTASFKPPTGEIIATAGSDGVVILWDTTTGQQVNYRSEHNGSIFGLAFSQDGSLITTVGEDGYAIVYGYDLNPIMRFKHGGGVSIYDVKFSHDNRYIVTSASDGITRFMPLSGSTPMMQIDAHPNSIVFETNFGWIGEQQIMLTAGSDGLAKLWNINLDKQIYKLRGVLPGHLDNVNSISFHGGQVSTAGNDGTVRIYWADINQYLTEQLYGE